MTVDKNILSILENLIPFPTFILDDDGRIVDFNQKGKKFLPDVTFNTSIFEVLDKEFTSVLERLLYEAKNYDKSVKENVLVQKGENDEEFEVAVTPFTDDVQKTFITTVRLIIGGKGKKELQRFTIVTEEIDKIVHDEDLFEIIKSVKSAFPFTFIGKAKIQKQIDMLEGFFWIKDNSRRYILVNQKFANVLGVKSKQLEGRFEKDVLPHFQNKLYSTIDSYINETTNSVIIEATSSVSPYGDQPYEVLEFPILDIDNNVVAIVGISQRVKTKSSSIDTSNKLSFDLVKDLGLKYLVSDSRGKIISYDEKVRKFFHSSQDITSQNISDLFEDDNIRQELTSFLKSQNNKIVLKYSESIELNVLRLQNEREKEPKILLLFNDQNNLDPKTAGILKMYDAIMKISPQPMFIYDIENLKFLEVNDAVVKLYGYSKDELLNMDLTDLYSPEDIQTLLESTNKKSQSNDFTGPWRHKKKDGTSIFVEISKSQLEFKGKSAHINIVRDVTEDIKQNKKIKLFKSAFENSSDLIFISDSDGFITYANESVIRTLGYTKHDLDKKPFLSLLKDDERAEFNKNIIHSTSKETKKIKTEIKNSSSELVEISFTATPIHEFNGELESIVLIGRIKQQQVKIVNEQPTISDSKGVDPSFLSNVFHEILTPINVILGFVQEINDGLTNPSSEQVEAIDIIKENQKLLLQTMDTAAEYSALEDNKIQFKPEEIVFVDLLEEIQSTTERTAKTNSLELTYGKISSSLKLTTDKHHFVILITQFLKYAMQISKENKIYLSAYTYGNDQSIVSIKDKRDGITTHLLNGLTDIFTKDEDSIRKSHGFSRITTKLFRKLIIALNARYEVISKDDKPIEYGIIFPDILEIEVTEIEDEFTAAVKEREKHLKELEEKQTIKDKKEVDAVQKDVNINVHVTSTPAKEPKLETPVVPKEIKKEVKPTPVSQQNRERKEVNLVSLKCLYVEDQIDSQILFKVQMKELDEIEFAKSFEEALPKIKSKEFDFIVMDINLEGEYNGLDALRVIQKLPGYQNKPIIAVTAYVLPGDRDKFIAAGFSDFISKPILKDKLVDVLEKIL